MKKNFLLTVILLVASFSSFAQNKPAFHIAHIFPIHSAGGYDYLTVDSLSNNLYVSHGSQVNILNKITVDSTGVIKAEKDVHGISLVPALGKGYISNWNYYRDS